MLPSRPRSIGSGFRGNGAGNGNALIVALHSDFTRTWNVKDYKCLPRIPAFYTLERTRASIRGVSPAEVAERISVCLRTMSLDSTYDDERAIAFVQSSDGTEFYVRLYQEADAANRGIVIELQKKSGCSFRFQRRARSILRAAKEGGVAASSLERRDGGSNIIRPLVSSSLLGRGSKPSLGGCDGPESTEQFVDRALESVDDLLKKDRVDANELGMERLVLLTDERSSGPERALYAAAALLRGGGDEKLEDLKRKVWSLVCSEDAGDEDGLSRYEGRHADAMRHRALAALANSFELLSRNGVTQLRAILDDEERVGGAATELLPALIDELGRAEVRPHDAYEAARCLNSIIETSAAMRRTAIALGAPAVLALSQGVGHCRHALLARESDLALAQLGESK